MSNELDDELRQELVAAVEASGVTDPEAACDWVLDAARTGGRDAGMAELARAIRANDAEILRQN